MAAHSDFFEALFTYEDKKEYRIGDVTQNVLKIILDLFYEMNCLINCQDDMILEIIATAKYLFAPFLLKKAIKISLKRLKEAIPQAEAYSDQISKILDFSRNFQIQELEDRIIFLFGQRGQANQLQNYQK